MKDLWKNILLAAASIAVGFLICEAIFRFYYHQKNMVPAITEDKRCAIDVYETHKNLLESKNFNLENRKHVTHPILGWEPKPNFIEGTDDTLSTGNGTEKIYALDTQYNSLGLRSSKDYSKKRPKGIVRISALGDSFTLGVDALQPFSYPAMLEAITKNTEVLNFGVSGYGVDQMYLRFLNETLDYENNAIVMGIFTDDLRRSAITCKDYLKPKFVIQDGRLKLTNTPIPTLEDYLTSYKEPKLESYFIKHLLNKIYHINLAERQYDDGFFVSKLILNEMKDITRKKNIFFMVVIVSPKEDQKIDKGMRGKLRDFLNEQDIIFIDSIDVFKKANLSDYKGYNFHVGGGHFNSLGNALVAQKIKNILEENKVIEKTHNYHFASNSFFSEEIMSVQNMENESDIRYITNIMPANSTLEIAKQYAPFKAKI